MTDHPEVLAQSVAWSDTTRDVLKYFRDRCETYVEDAPANGGHSDAAGDNAYGLIAEAVDQIDALLRLPVQAAAGPTQGVDDHPISTEEYFRGTLKVIANWAEVDLSGEWESGLRGIIRSITDAAREVLSAHPEGRPASKKDTANG